MATALDHFTLVNGGQDGTRATKLIRIVHP